MKSPLTPNDIEVLIHCYCCHAPHPRIEAPAVRESLLMWLDNAFIEQLSGTEITATFRTTPKGTAMIKALCRTPEPRCVYLDSEGKEL